MRLQYKASNGPIDDAIARLIEDTGGSPSAQYTRDLILSALKLGQDKVDLADLRLTAGSVREIRHALRICARFRGSRKVSIFGSARTAPDDPTTVLARAFAAASAARGWMVITGGGPGVMEGAQEGAGADRSFGLEITLPFETSANRIIRGDPKHLRFRYFFSRKLFFMREAHAVVLFPGGFGTLDEGFEALTLVQTGKNPPVPIVLLAPPGDDFWESWASFIDRTLLARGMIAEDDFNLFRITHDVGVAIEEIERFYRRYHSLRIVRNRVVLRLSTPMPPQGLERIREEFKDLCDEGTIEASGPLKEEENEPDLAGLSRLVLVANRRRAGRLRALIDAVNAI